MAKVSTDGMVAGVLTVVTVGGLIMMAVTWAGMPAKDIPSVPLFKPSATTMQTAKQPPAGKEIFFQCSARHQMPCVDMGADGQFYLYEPVAGNPAKETPVIVADVSKKDGDVLYMITRG